MTRIRQARWIVAPVSLAVVMTGVIAIAQPPAFVVTPLLRTDLDGDPRREVVLVRGEFAARASTGRHTHPGEEYAYVIEGTVEVRADGREPKRVTAGESYHNPRGVVHETRNVGDRTARVASTFIVDKGRAIVEPATSTSD